MRRFISFMAVFMFAVVGANADWAGLTNGSFETVNGTGSANGFSTPLSPGQFDVFEGPSEVAGWTSTDPDGIEIQRTIPSADGDQHAELDTHGAPTGEVFFGHNSSMSQSFTIDPADEGIFKLSFQYRTRLSERRNNAPGLNENLGTKNWDGQFNTADGIVSTFAVKVTLDGETLMIVDGGFNGAFDQWTSQMTSFQLDAGQHELAFMALGPADSYGGLLDMIALDRTGDVVIPEPSTYLLVGAGLVGLYFARRRRRQQA